MNVILIGILGLREIFGNGKGVAIVTQPLRWNIALPNPFVFISVCSAIMNEKLNNPIANTAVYERQAEKRTWKQFQSYTLWLIMKASLRLQYWILCNRSSCCTINMSLRTHNLERGDQRHLLENGTKFPWAQCFYFETRICGPNPWQKTDKIVSLLLWSIFQTP